MHALTTRLAMLKARTVTSLEGARGQQGLEESHVGHRECTLPRPLGRYAAEYDRGRAFAGRGRLHLQKEHTTAPSLMER